GGLRRARGRQQARRRRRLGQRAEALQPGARDRQDRAGARRRDQARAREDARRRIDGAAPRAPVRRAGPLLRRAAGVREGGAVAVARRSEPADREGARGSIEGEAEVTRRWAPALVSIVLAGAAPASAQAPTTPTPGEYGRAAKLDVQAFESP